ncbi:MAG: VOC family protein [Candidatus Pseudobacter hemicellulosilyticus]|uniref:VOC family protein n=1 Tax=Candidatus Pseudobacter hemicellulosilyticus TaxID=3121375 RepID=A0AAJ5WRT5_9BACT|nr:MAG: VOC family protein [Pseudobacter sp.]
MASNIQPFTYCIWQDRQGSAMADLYISLFGGKKGATTYYTKAGIEEHGQAEGSEMAVSFEIGGLQLMALSAGPMFRPNPSISFSVICETEAEVDRLWTELVKDGKVMMPLDKYDWSARYGFLEDRFGVSWQLMLGKLSDVGQPITPTFLFVKDRFGQAEAAVRQYTDLFPQSTIVGMLKHQEGPYKDTVLHTQFKLNNQVFMAMDGPGEHQFGFTEGFSIMVNCPDQETIDYYWEKLGAGGDPNAQVCGWLKDRFGVSWQIVPTELEQMMLDPDKSKVERVTNAFMSMKKLDLAAIRKAYAGQ